MSAFNLFPVFDEETLEETNSTENGLTNYWNDGKKPSQAYFSVILVFGIILLGIIGFYSSKALLDKKLIPFIFYNDSGFIAYLSFVAVMVIFGALHVSYIFVHKKKYSSPQVINLTFAGYILVIISTILLFLTFLFKKEEAYQGVIIFFIVCNIISIGLFYRGLELCNEKDDKKSVSLKAVSYVSPTLQIFSTIGFAIIPFACKFILPSVKNNSSNKYNVASSDLTNFPTNSLFNNSAFITSSKNNSSTLKNNSSNSTSSNSTSSSSTSSNSSKKNNNILNKSIIHNEVF